MGISRRVARLETALGVGPDADGACGYCRGRELELGRVVVVYQPPREPEIRFGHARPNPGPTPCPRCGRDLNVTVVVEHVDMVAQKRREAGLPPLVPLDL